MINNMNKGGSASLSPPRTHSWLGGCKAKLNRVCLITMGAGGQAWASKTCNVLETPLCCVYYRTHHGWGRRKKCEVKVRFLDLTTDVQRLSDQVKHW